MKGFLAGAIVVLTAAASAQAESFVDQCTFILYRGGREIAKSKVCSYESDAIAKAKREFDEKCKGMFSVKQQNDILSAALQDAQAEFKKAGAEKFCGGE